jgi:hypothetical protein
MESNVDNPVIANIQLLMSDFGVRTLKLVERIFCEFVRPLLEKTTSTWSKTGIKFIQSM